MWENLEILKVWTENNRLWLVKSKCAQLLLINKTNMFWLSTITPWTLVTPAAHVCRVNVWPSVIQDGIFGLGLKGLFWLLDFCFCFSYYLTGLFWSGVWVSLVSSKTFLRKYSLVRSCSWWYLVNEWYIWFFKGFAFVCLCCFHIVLTSDLLFWCRGVG